ncbi:SAF domain-containing protein [Rhodovulum imhoffii]|uniref:SAF domain-containing protein n=1 Tax=Rhodovulum imhoffii TaxID=365340 RepID=A0A2T5BSD8_9RHOB|nr:UxaA family hydrolase [Rhodovulum imhoffii]MBK5933502.1 hypothetical protein [Rhodovulum imhoffii]PTN02262.1 SAF domain-containing protein [Rhodovulum imhoffii]
MTATKRPAGNGRLLRLSEADNVLVATAPLAAGRAAINGGGEIDVLAPVTLGHKIASRPIEKGEKILKYGVPIGSATENIAPGAHVHVHNLQSDYTPTYALGETAWGDKDA